MTRSPVRLAQLLLAAAIALWAVLGVMGNLLDWANASRSVETVVSMSSIAGGSTSWRAIHGPGVVIAGVTFIVLFKATAAYLAILGMWRMHASRAADERAFHRAKSSVLAGCMVGMLGLFLGWIVIGEGWFELWKSPLLREAAGQTAFRYGGMIALIGLLIAIRSDD